MNPFPELEDLLRKTVTRFIDIADACMPGC